MASSSNSTQLLYACIAHNTTILTEHTASASSNTSSLPALILPSITHTTPSKQIFSRGPHLIHSSWTAPSQFPAAQASAGGLTFLCITDKTVRREIAFGFLVNLQKKFLEDFDPAENNFADLSAYGCASFNAVLRRMMQDQGSTAKGQQDAISTAKREIDGVREIMEQNIDRLLERGEHMTALVNKTDQLGTSSRDFRVRSRGLRRRMWWKNVKLMVLLALVVIFLIYLFVGFGCGLPGWSRCLRN
ncbi:vesicle-associated membrane protein-like protein [Massariosphaeria phaeospora]|uniref:Synaptobrevin homolog YKT6 n=1 Tax=Massariosphaeria phaeospora TaxID=100035 RepID=A0A7C8HZH2_9PLEO|nr:vesicle-associated membrane protein-like protein [Massariosphaeria phaeospora]